MTVANPPVQSASPYKGLLARHPLVFYFLHRLRRLMVCMDALGALREWYWPAAI